VHRAIPLPGSFVWIRQRRWRLERVRVHGRIVRFDVEGREGRATFLAPFDRPTSIGRRVRPVRRRRQHVGAATAQILAGAFTIRTLRSAVRSRIALLPFQLEPALAIMHGARRVLIADAVGLGKTIQAGLVLAEVLRREHAVRALLAVPAGLAGQWADEIFGRFDIPCTVADRASLEKLSREVRHGENPWLRSGVWLASLDYLKQPHVLRALPPVPWDLVVIDEAHTAVGDSGRHDAARFIARRARRVVLLSATPHSGDDARFARLVDLGAVGGPGDDLVIFHRTRDSAGEGRVRRVSWHRVGLSKAGADFLDALCRYERATLEAAGTERRDTALMLLSVFRKRALSTAVAAARTLARRRAWLDERLPVDESAWTQPTLDFEDGDDISEDERDGLFADTGLPVRDERGWLERLIELAARAAQSDAKIARLVALVARATEPVVIFTEFRASLEAVLEHSPPAWRVAPLHGGLSDAERRRALARFSRGEARVLLATDVAGQGLNLQSAARWVVSMELPWNPARLEQRFGRVDRIGQQRPVHLTLLVARHPAEDGLLAHLARRTLAARQALGPDVLTAASPSESQLRAAVLGVADEAGPARRGTTVPLCRTWVRPARSQARALERVRSLVGRWPIDARLPSPIVWRSPHSSWTGSGIDGGGVLVFDVPIVDAFGSVLEMRPVPVAVPLLHRPADLTPEVRARASRAAAVRLEARLARVDRLRSGIAALAFDHEAAIRAVLVKDLASARVQLGLFSRKALADCERASRWLDLVDRRFEQRALDMRASLEIGRPVLRLVILPRN